MTREEQIAQLRADVEATERDIADAQKSLAWSREVLAHLDAGRDPAELLTKAEAWSAQ